MPSTMQKGSLPNRPKVCECGHSSRAHGPVVKLLAEVSLFRHIARFVFATQPLATQPLEEDAEYSTSCMYCSCAKYHTIWEG